MAYAIKVGRASEWIELPIGTEWTGWKQQRKHKLVEVPLAHGAIDVADGMWKALTVRLRICLYGSTVALHEQDVISVYQTLMAKQSMNSAENQYLAVFDGGMSYFEVKYDKLVDIGIAFVTRTKSRHSYTTFTLSCHTTPFNWDLYHMDGS